MSAAPAPPREDYHHGNLAGSALQEGLRALEAGEDLSLRAIARSVGVAHRALFNHFSDRSAFEAELAALGFARLAGTLQIVETPSDFVRTYLGFALQQAALYDLMMRQSNGALDRSPSLRAAVDGVIGKALAVLAPDASNAEEGRRRVMQIWMIAHGGIGLHRSGILRERSDAAFVEELLCIARLTAPPVSQGLLSEPF